MGGGGWFSERMSEWVDEDMLEGSDCCGFIGGRSMRDGVGSLRGGMLWQHGS